MAQTERQAKVTLQDRCSLLLYRTCLLGSLLGFAATFYFLAGLSGYIGSPLLNVATTAVLVFAALFFLYVFVQIRDRGLPGLLIWLSILLVLIVEVILGTVPPAARDELTHHLAMPKLYVNAGRIVEVPFDPHSYFPMLLDMLYTPFVKWGWDSVPKLIHGLFGFLTGVLLYSYLARRLNPVYGLLAFFSYVSTPVILRLSNLAYVDLGLTFYSTASLLCLLRWIEATEVKHWLILAGLSAGFALATKPNGFLVFLLLFFLLVFVPERVGRGKMFATIGWASLFLLLAFIPFSPWLFKNLIQTGDPVFPFFAGLFGVEVESEEPVLGIFTKRQLLYGESWWQIAALPLRIFFSGQDDNPQYFDGVLNPILILFLPWAFKGKWVQEKKFLFAFPIFYFLYALFLSDLRIRYILPIVPPLVILLVYGVHNVYLRISHPSFLFTALLLLYVLNGVYLWGYFYKVSPMGFLLQKEGREAYLTRVLPDYPVFQYVSQNLPSTARVYLIFMGRRGYYCKCDYFYDGGDNAWILLRTIQSARDGGEVKVKLQLQQRGITHLLVREELLKRFLANNLTPEERTLWYSFSSRHLQVLFQARGYSLFQIYG